MLNMREVKRYVSINLSPNNVAAIIYLIYSHTFIFCRLRERRTPSGTSLMTHGAVGQSQTLTARREADDMCATGVELTLTM